MKRHIETRKRAKELRSNLTPPERKLWNAIRANRIGVKFQRQVVLPPYIADFAARSEHLIIELDGDTHAGREAYDAARTVTPADYGYRVLRVTNGDVVNNLGGVLRAILIALGRDPESPRHLQGERESRSEAEAGSGG
jgi:very-short-patch-repair endonuclease